MRIPEGFEDPVGGKKPDRGKSRTVSGKMAAGKPRTLGSVFSRTSERLHEAPAVKLQKLREELRKPSDHQVSLLSKANQLGIAKTSYIRYDCHILVKCRDATHHTCSYTILYRIYMC